VSVGLLALGVVIPQLIWNWLMGFVVSSITRTRASLVR
jgi:hypothetical protein